MSIISISKIVAALERSKNKTDYYTYTRVSNMINGKRGRSTKKDIQQVRKVIQDELAILDKKLAKLENEI